MSMVRSLSNDDKELVQGVFPELELPDPDEIDEEFSSMKEIF